MGRRGRRKGSQGRAEGRVRGRVRQPGQGSQGRGQGGTSRKQGTFDVGDIEGYAQRLRGSVGGSGRGTSGLAGAASGLAGGSLAGGLAGNLAHGLRGDDSGGSDEDFENEVREHLDLIDERLGWLEEQMRGLVEEGGEQPPENP